MRRGGNLGYGRGRPGALGGAKMQIQPRRSFGLDLIFRSMFGKYRLRSAVALSLMIAQAFLFNAVFFSNGLLLATFYGVQENRTGTHLLLLAISNFLGPVLLGSFFDTIGRRVMIVFNLCGWRRSVNRNSFLVRLQFLY